MKEMESKIAFCKKQLASKGYAYLQDIEDGANYLEFLSNFGQFIPQYDGKIVWEIQAKEEFEKLYHSLNSNPLFPHTECYEFEGLPNKYQVLWAVNEGNCGGGKTTLADAYEILDYLTSEEVELLKSTYNFSSSAGIKSSNLGRIARHPIIEYSGKNQIFRFSRNCMDYENSQELIELADKIVKYFENNHIQITWEKNALLIWDNYRMLHSRTGFKDKSRKLNRVWMSEN